MLVVGGDDGVLVVGGEVGMLVGALVGLRVKVGFREMLGFSDGAALVVGRKVGLLEVGIAVVGVAVSFEHPAVLLTSATTASLHRPFMSAFATQKNAPPLHANCPLLVVLRSAMT